MSSYFQLLTSYSTLGKTIDFCEPQFTNLCNNVDIFVSSKYLDSIKLYVITIPCWWYRISHYIL